MVQPDDDFDAYVRARYERFCRYAFALCGDWQHAEDLVQASLASCYPAFRRGVSHPDAYVLRAILNRYRSWRRRLWHRERPTAELPEVATLDPDSDLRATVMARLRCLPVAQRAVVALRFLCDQSEEDTARVLGVSVGTVKSRTFRALAALRTGDLADDEPADRRTGDRHA
jgi:RNA polymerase sigma-70 factor (sigma-E family)